MKRLFTEGMVNGKLAFIFLVFLLVSCERLLMESDAPNDPISIFEEIWSFTDRHYSFFDEKEIDWQEVYDRYRPRVLPDMSNVALFDLCADMLFELRDGHVNLVSSFDRSRNWDWYLEHPENFYYSLIQRFYFKDRQRYIGPFQYLDMGDLIYIYYGSFAQPVSESNLNLLLSSLKNKKGLIIDVRNNGGGNPDNALRIARRFTNEKRLAGTNWIKNGPGHQDFRTREVHIKPYDGLRYSGPVVVLTNRKSYSATTYFAQYMSVLDNTWLVGDTTGGGGGLPAFRDLANGWLLRVSASRFLDPRGKSIESGVVPDIVIHMDEKMAFAEGLDPIIEQAKALIRTGIPVSR